MSPPMSKHKGKFVGAYVDSRVKKKLSAIAVEQDRPLSYIIEKILAEGVKHLTETNLKKAA